MKWGNKKKLFAGLIMMTAVLLGSAQAAQVERLPDSEDYSAVVADTQDSVIRELNAFGSGKGSSDAAVKVTKQDVDWREAYRVYGESGDLFAQPDADYVQLQDELDYEWVLPVEINGSDLYATLAKTGNTPTAKWEISGITQDMPVTAAQVEKRLDEIGKSADAIMLIGGSEEQTAHMVVLKHADKPLEVVLLSNKETTIPPERKSLSAGAEPQQDVLYAFSDVASAMQKQDTIGLCAVLILLGAGVVLVVAWWLYRRKKHE